VRNQMGRKESARPQALLYVVPKAFASAIWPFLKASPHPGVGPGTPGGEGCLYPLAYHALQWFCPEIEPGAPGIGILHPHGVASS